MTAGDIRDKGGRLIRRKVAGRFQNLGYDGRNRLTRWDWDGSAGTSCTYDYDHAGRRILTRETVGGATKVTRYVYDGADVCAEYEDSNNDGAVDRTRVYWLLPGMDRRIGFAETVNNTTTFYYYLTDHVGTVMRIVKEDGTVVNQYDYDAFGRVRSRSEGVENRYLFQGREWDKHGGFYYFRNRIYLPERGEFATPDMNLGRGILGELDGMATLTFCGGDPVNLTDPTGLAIETASFEAEVVNGVPMVRRRTLEWTFWSGRAGAREVPGSRTGWEKAGADDMHWFYKSSDGSWETVGYGMAAGRNFGSNVREQAKGFAVFEAAMFTAGVGLAATPAVAPSLIKTAEISTPYVVTGLKSGTAKRIYQGVGTTLAYRVVTEASGQKPSWGGDIGSFMGGFIGGNKGVVAYAAISQLIDNNLGSEKKEFDLYEFGLDLSVGIGANFSFNWIKVLPDKMPKYVFSQQLKAACMLEKGKGHARRVAMRTLKKTQEYIGWNRLGVSVAGASDAISPVIQELIDSKTGMEAKNDLE